jgi:peptidoglycan/xylan/chitin deacetylase (PgdA/CDA1 family)
MSFESGAHATSPWLEGAAAAFVLTIPVDAQTFLFAESRRFAREPLAMSHQAYEPQVAVPRLLKVLDELSVTATFFVPGWTLETYPAVGQAVLAAGHELGHHSYSHRKPIDMKQGEERRDFERALETLAALGVTPTGHRAAYWSPSVETLSLIAEHGLRYDCSLMGDDRPYFVDTPRGSVVELPPHWAMDDWEQYAYLPRADIGRNVESPDEVLSLWRSELDGIRRHGGLFQLTCHAFLSGRPARALVLAELVDYARGTGDVTFMTCAEAARRATADPGLRRRPDVQLDVDPAVYPVY